MYTCECSHVFPRTIISFGWQGKLRVTVLKAFVDIKKRSVKPKAGEGNDAVGEATEENLGREEEREAEEENESNDPPGTGELAEQGKDNSGQAEDPRTPVQGNEDDAAGMDDDEGTDGDDWPGLTQLTGSQTPKTRKDSPAAKKLKYAETEQTAQLANPQNDTKRRKEDGQAERQGRPKEAREGNQDKAKALGLRRQISKLLREACECSMKLERATKMQRQLRQVHQAGPTAAVPDLRKSPRRHAMVPARRPRPQPGQMLKVKK